MLIFSCLDHLVHKENAITLPFNTEKSLCPFNRLILILNLYPAQFSFRKTLGKVSLPKKSFLISQVSIVLKNSFGTKSVISIFFSRLGLNDSLDAAVVADDPGRNEGDLFDT